MCPCARVRDAGVPIERVAFFFWSLHLQYFGVALFWDGEKVTLAPGKYEMMQADAYLENPAAGVTDYVIAGVVSGDGVRNSVSLATRRPGGFTGHNIAKIERLLQPEATKTLEAILARRATRAGAGALVARFRPVAPRARVAAFARRRARLLLGPGEPDN